MGQRQYVFCVFLYLLQISVILLFLIGFFPVDDAFQEEIEQTRQTKKMDARPTKKLVLLIIDALRVDFMGPDSKQRMPFLDFSIARNESCFLRVRAAAPTVTMPRIKAITSGAIPNYLDIVMNLGSSEFHQDTFLRQAVLHNYRIVFYGDDTWLKMFPSLFVRSGGTHSFFAADFWEVDKNVTLQLTKELGRTDWDIMVVHYLGLDHIGHMEGPQSPHVAPKLAEMDHVIKQIYDAMRNQKQECLVIVTGDHGMKDSGGHGGITDAEVTVPLVSVGRPCATLPGWPGPSEHSPPQIDIASTLATALGLPVPSGNLGKLIPALLTDFSALDILGKLREIRQQLKKRAESQHALKDGLTETDTLLQEALESNATDDSLLQKITEKYFVELSSLSEDLTRQRSDFNLIYMVFGCLSLWALLVAFFLFVRNAWPCNALQLLLSLGTLAHTLSLASTSFIEEEHQTWYFLWTTLLLLCLRERWRRKAVVRSYVLDVKTCSLLLLCTLHRFLRKLNQTGDKWAHLPDWDDSLRSNQLLLVLVFILSLVWMYDLFIRTDRHIQEKTTFLAALLCISAYRLSVGSFQVFTHVYPQSRGSNEVTAFLGVLLFWCYLSSRSEGPAASWTWALLMALTLRPHNVILVPAQIFVSRQLYHVFSREENPYWNTLAHAWLGYLFYFYQGNSNSLANVDVAPAFIGVDSYNPLYAAALTTVHTFGAPVHAILLSPQDCKPILISRLLPTTVYCSLLTLQRHHLFIWSVFSPKLLLDFALSFVLLLVVCLQRGGRLTSKRT